VVRFAVERLHDVVELPRRADCVFRDVARAAPRLEVRPVVFRVALRAVLPVLLRAFVRAVPRLDDVVVLRPLAVVERLRARDAVPPRARLVCRFLCAMEPSPGRCRMVVFPIEGPSNHIRTVASVPVVA
jgi:hypothetical protein